MMFLLSNWKLIAGAGLAIGAFLLGWNINGNRWESKWNAAVAARAAAVEDERIRLRQEFEEQRREDDAAREGLARTLADLRQRNVRLQNDLTSAQLVREPDPQVVVEWRERVIREEIDCSVPILANPFGADFVRLYNDSANRGIGLPGAD